MNHHAQTVMEQDSSTLELSCTFYTEYIC